MLNKDRLIIGFSKKSDVISFKPSGFNTKDLSHRRFSCSSIRGSLISCHLVYDVRFHGRFIVAFLKMVSYFSETTINFQFIPLREPAESSLKATSIS